MVSTNHSLSEDKGEPKRGIEPTSSAYRHAVPLGQTDSPVPGRRGKPLLSRGCADYTGRCVLWQGSSPETTLPSSGIGFKRIKSMAQVWPSAQSSGAVCVKVEVAVLGSPPLIVLMVFV